MKVDHEVLKVYLNAQDKELTKLHNYIEDLEDCPAPKLCTIFQ